MAEYTDFPSPEDTQPGDIVIKNGRQWYYDSTKWVLFTDPKNTGDDQYRGVVPIKVDPDGFEAVPGDPDSTRRIIETSIDLTTLPPAN